jgi:hypothetical protein
VTHEERFERIERTLEFLAGNQAQLSADVSRLSADVSRLSTDIGKLVGVVSDLVKIFERHIGDGHGGR